MGIGVSPASTVRHRKGPEPYKILWKGLLEREFSCNRDTLCLRALEPEIESGCVLVWKKNLALLLAMIRFAQHVKEYLDRKG